MMVFTIGEMKKAIFSGGKIQEWITREGYHYTCITYLQKTGSDKFKLLSSFMLENH